VAAHRTADRSLWRYTVLFGPPRVVVPMGGRTINLSAKGLCLQADEVYPPGTELRLVLQPHEEGPFELLGHVVWSRQSARQMGIRLTQWDDEYPDFVRRAEATLHPRERPSLAPPPRVEEPEPDLTGPLSWPSGLRHPRFDDQLPVRFGLGGSLDRKGFTGNISRTGISVATSEAVPPGTRLTVAITLPNEEIARLEGTVAWSNVTPGAGTKAALGVQIVTSDTSFADLVEEWERHH
jgi:hypothetical protein